MRSRTRQVHPEFFQHEGLSELEFRTGLPLRIAFVGLWTVADKRGCFLWRPRALKREILPDDTLDFEAVLTALEEGGFVRRYSDDDGTYGVIPSFPKWQHFHHREKPHPHIPDPPGYLIRVKAPGQPPTSPTASASASASASAIPLTVPLTGETDTGTETRNGHPPDKAAVDLDPEPVRRHKRRPSSNPASRDTYVDRVIRREV